MCIRDRSQDELKKFVNQATTLSPDHPVVITKFMLGALEVDVDGKISRSSVTIGGVAAAPVRMTEIETSLIGLVPNEEKFREICEVCRGIEALGDVYASTEYRQHLATVLSRRALVKAYERAKNER